MKSFLFFSLFFCTIQSYGQIVNIEDKRSHRSDTSGFFGNLDLGLNIVENGNTVITLRGGMQMEYLKEKHLFLSISKFNLVKVEVDNFVNDGFQHFRYNRALNKKISYEAFLQGQYNERIRIQFRGLAGTGLRYQLLKKDHQKAYFGSSYIYEYESIQDTSITHHNHRWSNYLSFNLEPISNLIFSGTTYYQPLFTNFQDFRLSNQTAVQVQITSKLSLKIAFNLTFDSRLKEDAPDAPKVIYSLTNGLRWVF